MTLLDTDILIDYLKGWQPVTVVLQELFPAGGLGTTVISKFELLAATRQTAVQRQAVEKLLSVLKIVELDSDSASAAGIVKRALSAEGNDVGMADCLIAGIALANGLSLLTRNRRRFDRVPRLKLVDLDKIRLRSKTE